MEENNKPLQPQTTPTPQQQEVKAPKISVILMLIFVLGLTVFIVWGIYKAAFPPAPPLQGQWSRAPSAWHLKSPVEFTRFWSLKAIL